MLLLSSKTMAYFRSAVLKDVASLTSKMTCLMFAEADPDAARTAL